MLTIRMTKVIMQLFFRICVKKRHMQSMYDSSDIYCADGIADVFEIVCE